MDKKPHRKTFPVLGPAHGSSRLTQKLVFIKNGQCTLHSDNYSYGGAILISAVLQPVTQGEYVRKDGARIFVTAANAEKATATSRSNSRTKEPRLKSDV